MLTLSEVVQRNIKSYVRGSLFTSIPAKIERIDTFGSEQTVDVKPLIRRKFEDGTELESGAILGVPVVFPSGGGGLLSFPVAVGDTVLVVFSMRSMDEWVESDGQKVISPLSSRSHNPTDAIAIPGLFTYSSHLSPNTEDVELKFKEMSIRLDKNNNIFVENSKVSLALGSDGQAGVANDGGYIVLGADGTVDINGAIINTDGSITSPVSVTAPTIEGSSSVIAAGKELVSHLHSGVTSGPATSGPNI